MGLKIRVVKIAIIMGVVEAAKKTNSLSKVWVLIQIYRKCDKWTIE